MRLSHLSDHQSSRNPLRQKLPLAVILPLSVGLAVGGPISAAFATSTVPVIQATQVAQQVPQADLLDVSFEDGATDAAQGREVTTFGDPKVGMDPLLARNVAEFDGDAAYSYPLTSDDYDAMQEGFTVECSFMATAATTGEDTFCGNKEAGGWALVVKDGRAAFMLHANGGYTFAWTDIELNQWYHAVGAYDGETIRLYLDGELAAEAHAGGPMTIPPNETAHNMVIGADSGPNGQPGQHAAVKIDDARLFSQPFTAAQIAAMHDEFQVEIQTPIADLLNVDFADGTAADTAQNLPADLHSDPEIAMDPALGRHTVTFDGDDAIQYPFGDQYSKMTDAFSVECVFRYNGDLPSSGQTNLCANKEAGGFAVAMFENKLTFELHTGSYQNIGVEIEPNEWYHAVAVFDGANQMAQLYVNGQLAAEVETVGTQMVWPPDTTAHNMTLGADSSKGGSQFHSTSTLASARVFSQPLNGAQVAALNLEAFDGLRDQQATINASTPAVGGELTRATEFSVDWNNPGLVAQGTTYSLNGEDIAPGDVIGAGLEAGEHEIVVEGKTVFGLPLSQSIAFTSGSIPEIGGVETGQGEGTVSLSAIAHNPDGGDVTSTFYEGRADLADAGFQGLVDELPSSLEFEYDQAAELDGSGESLAADPGQIAFQRFDVDVGDAAEGQSVRWAGNVDPSRQVNLMVWNTADEDWQTVASGRGLTQGELVLSGEITADHLDKGVASVMVVGEDPFADDLDNEIADSFEDVDDYDFAIAHLTDTQYLSEGAVERAYSDEQQKVWASSYLDMVNWIADNADERKIAYVAHTGDIIENWHTSTERKDEDDYRQIAMNEFEFASETQKVLDDAEIVNGVLPGNHDNRSGNDVGADSLYNDYFYPERYEALEETAGWQEMQASYTPWRAGDNENHYDLFTAGGLDFIAVHLGFDVTQEELNWASDVLDDYPDRNAMVMTHAQRKPSTNPDGRGAGFSHDGSRIDQSLLRQHNNVFLVLAGHEHGVDIEVRKDVGQAGNNIVELLADYQFYTVPAEELGLTGIDGRNPDDMLRFGASFFRMLQIDVDAAEMAVDTYSPILDNFGATEYDDRSRYNGTEDDTRLPIQLETRQTSFVTEQVMVTTPTDEVIGEATTRSGWPATVAWSGLTEGETYAWYVTSTDAETDDDLPAGEARQMGVFTATAAGTDDVAPELTVPDHVTITAGDAFDPMAGVSATDNTDGDLTDDIQVIGSLDTAKPGVYVLTYMVEDTNGNQATAARAITVTEALDDNSGDGGNADGSDNPDDDGNADDSDNANHQGSPSGGSGGNDSTDTGGDTQDNGSSQTGGQQVSGSGDETLDSSKHDTRLANTGTQRALLLTLGGLLSVGAGITVWWVSRRHKSAN